MKSSDLKLTRRIRTSMYLDQRFASAELDLLHTPSLQRLYDVRQLGFADRVFIDASHSRLSHVLGVMEVATQLCTAITRNLGRSAKANVTWSGKEGEKHISCEDLAKEITEQRVAPIRLMALLHDLTHAPFGHTLEDEIKLVHPSHDHPDRQAQAFFRLVLEYLAWTSVDLLPEAVWNRWDEKLGLAALLRGDPDFKPSDYPPEKLIPFGVFLLERRNGEFGRTRVTAEEMAQLLIDLNFATRALYHLEVSHKFGEGLEVPASAYPVNDLLEGILLNSPHNKKAAAWAVDAKEDIHLARFAPTRDAYCLDLIGNTICADLLDYARRDALNAGLPLAFDVSRIIEHFIVVSYKEEQAKPGHPWHGTAVRAAVEFSNNKFRGDVIGELMQLLQVRYYVYERMLFHPTKCVAGAMLGRAVQLLGFTRIPTAWQQTGDAVFLYQLAETATMVERTLRSHADVTERYFPMLANGLLSRYSQEELLNVRLTRQALKDRIVTIGELRRLFGKPYESGLILARLYHSVRIIDGHRLAALESFQKVLADPSWKDGTELGPREIELLVSAISQQLNHVSGMGATDAKTAAKTALLELLPTIEEYLQEVQGASRLIARLRSRRYAKRIFCLLPNTHVRAGGVKLERREIANRFLDPHLRAAAERAIERLAKLPAGSVVIHCPPADGPRKLAKVLVTYRSPDKKRERATTILRKIADIEGPAKGLFSAHQSHLSSLEDMYSSMWRLWVAVAPPKDKDYGDLAKYIGEVMSACVLNGAPWSPIGNDPFMVEELMDMYGQDPAEAEPPGVPLIRTVRAEARDAALTIAEVEAILRPYFQVFSAGQQRTLESRLKASELTRKIAARTADPGLRLDLTSRALELSISSPKWDARDIDRFLNFLNQFTGTKLVDEPEVSYRRLNKVEKAALQRLRLSMERERITQQLANGNGAFRVAGCLRAENIKVVFKPLLTTGLYGESAGQHVIYVNAPQGELAEYQRLYEAEEISELLPPHIRFTLAHELVHYLISTRIGYDLLRGKDPERMGEVNERICNQLAGELLLSDDALQRLFTGNEMTADSLMRACLHFGVHPRHLIIRIDELSTFHSLPNGYALSYARRDGSKLKNVQGASNQALHSELKCLRELAGGDTLPISLPNSVNFSGIVQVTPSQDANSLVPVSLSSVPWGENWLLVFRYPLPR